MNELEFQKHLQARVKKKLEPLFTRYKMDFSGLDATLKWKPIVLIIGNYSSGKSTFINEIVGQNIQRTGQAPTDDSFTIITSDPEIAPKEIPGSTVVNDQELPFQHFKGFGEKFISHVCMKQVESPVLLDWAIIDSPGMIDATSENDRGYDYKQVLGEFAKMADLIVLMFDSHKAGTIKESYETIRNTLPEKSGEHRIIFVMNRIDECDNLSDFTRSYGTLCWNMSQMTGRKDIPHIYLTYAPSVVDEGTVSEDWPQERQALIEKIKQAPSFRLNHILEDIDRQVNELAMVASAVGECLSRAHRLFRIYFKIFMTIAITLLLFGDVMLNSLIDFPDRTLITSIRAGRLSLETFIVPSVFTLSTLMIGMIAYSKFGFRSQKKKALEEEAHLVELDNDYRRSLWKKVEEKAKENIKALRVKDLWSGYGWGLSRINSFLNNDLKKYYEKIK